MPGMSCRTSSSSSCTSPPHLNSLGSLHRWLPKNILNTSPRLSSNFTNIQPSAMPVPNRASLLLPSDKDGGFDSADSKYSNASLVSKHRPTFCCEIQSTNTDGAHPMARRCSSMDFAIQKSRSSSGVSVRRWISQLESYAELHEEILTLELEIMHLERYLLARYRTALEDCMPTISSKPGNDLKFSTLPSSKTLSDQHSHRLEPQSNRAGLEHQAQAYPTHYWSSSESQNLSHGRKPKFAKNRKNGDSVHRSLADYFGVSSIDDAHSPDRLSENIMRCISSIYCNLAHSTQNNGDLSTSPTSSLSSSSIFSSKNNFENWTPKCKDHRLRGSIKCTDESATMVEITKISIDDKNFNYAAVMLQNFRSLVRDLEKVDPTKMKREQKLAFWINVHNALVMHAYLAYGICNRARNASILKAAYNVGGECINALDIQSSILGIRSHHSAPWLQTLFNSGRKLKTGITAHPYALEYAEPLVNFALCSGSRSDPAVRVYRAKSIFEDLNLAKEEFVRERVHVDKEARISMPKMLYNFGKDMSVSTEGVVDMLNECGLSEVQKRGIRRWKRGRPGTKIEWIPYSSSFRYLIHGDLACFNSASLPVL